MVLFEDLEKKVPGVSAVTESASLGYDNSSTSLPTFLPFVFIRTDTGTVSNGLKVSFEEIVSDNLTSLDEAWLLVSCDCCDKTNVKNKPTARISNGIKTNRFDRMCLNINYYQYKHVRIIKIHLYLPYYIKKWKCKHGNVRSDIDNN